MLGHAHIAVVGRSGELLGEERVAGCGGGDRLERPSSQPAFGGAFGDLGQRGGRQGAQHDLDAGALLGQAGAHARQLGTGLAMAGGEDDQHGRLASGAGQVVGQEQRRHVGDMEILQRQKRARLTRGGVDELPTAANT